jgi:hypothetical protein
MTQRATSATEPHKTRDEKERKVPPTFYSLVWKFLTLKCLNVYSLSEKRIYSTLKPSCLVKYRPKAFSSDIFQTVFSVVALVE